MKYQSFIFKIWKFRKTWERLCTKEKQNNYQTSSSKRTKTSQNYLTEIYLLVQKENQVVSLILSCRLMQLPDTIYN